MRRENGETKRATAVQVSHLRRPRSITHPFLARDEKSSDLLGGPVCTAWSPQETPRRGDIARRHREETSRGDILRRHLEETC